MIMWGFLGSMFGFGGGLMYSACGAILFCGYIVFDTHRVMEVYGPDDAIVAAIELYLDVINLFMYLLELLSAMSGSARRDGVRRAQGPARPRVQGTSRDALERVHTKTC